MTTTTNFGLKKLASSDPIDVSVLNDNADTLDAFAGEVNESFAGKQDTLTFDTAPTEGSTNPVTSGGIKTDQNRQDALEAADRAALVELVDGGAKNLLKNEAATQTSNGVTFTVNADGTVTANGTATENATCRIATNFSVPANSVLSGCPDGGSETTYDLRLGSAVKEYGSGTAIDTATTGNVSIIIRAGQSLDNLTFSPMICTKAAWDISQKYVPYRPSYDEIIARIESLENT